MCFKEPDSNLTSRKIDNLLKVMFIIWQPVFAIRMEKWNVGMLGIKAEIKPF